MLRATNTNQALSNASTAPGTGTQRKDRIIPTSKKSKIDKTMEENKESSGIDSDDFADCQDPHQNPDTDKSGFPLKYDKSKPWTGLNDS